MLIMPVNYVFGESENVAKLPPVSTVYYTGKTGDGVTIRIACTRSYTTAGSVITYKENSAAIISYPNNSICSLYSVVSSGGAGTAINNELQVHIRYVLNNDIKGIYFIIEGETLRLSTNPVK